MKGLAMMLGLVAMLGCGSVDAGAQEAGKKIGDAKYLTYEGTQNWPTGDRAQIISDFSVPIYLGLPNKRYTVLGRVYDDRSTGIGVMTRAFAEGLFSEKDRQRDCADQAKYRGGDAVLVTNDERIITALGGHLDERVARPLDHRLDEARMIEKDPQLIDLRRHGSHFGLGRGNVLAILAATGIAAER